MPGTALACPECGTTLRTADPSPAGKLIECPQRRCVFRAPGAAPQPPAAPPGETRVQCTHCGATLRSAQPLPPGRLVQCLTCKTIFPVPGPRGAPPAAAPRAEPPAPTYAVT